MATDTRIRQARNVLHLNAEWIDATETYQDAPSNETFAEMLTRAELLNGYMLIVQINDIDTADKIVNGCLS